MMFFGINSTETLYMKRKNLKIKETLVQHFSRSDELIILHFKFRKHYNIL